MGPQSTPRIDPNAAMLRRFLRAVLADQASGDRLLAALWPAVKADLRRREIERAEPTDVICPAMRRWRQVVKADHAVPFSARSVVEALPSPLDLARVVGLLVDVFSLGVSEAARAVDRSEGEVVRLLASSRSQRQAPIDADVLLVEDDPLVAHHLAHVARGAGASAVRIAADASEAFALAADRVPDIVLTDYALGPGPDGAAVIERLARDYDCVCICVTAYPEAMLSGSDHEPAFLISKPFRDGVVEAALYFASSAERPSVLAA